MMFHCRVSMGLDSWGFEYCDSSSGWLENIISWNFSQLTAFSRDFSVSHYHSDRKQFIPEVFSTNEI